MRTRAVKADGADRAVTRFFLLSALSALSALTVSPAHAQVPARHFAFSPTTEETLYPLR